MLSTIKNKLRLAFFVMASLFLAFGMLAINNMGVINQQSTDIEKNWLPSVVLTNDINAATGDLRITEALHVLSTVDTEMEQREQDMQHTLKKIAELRAKYEPLISSPEERAKYGEFAKGYDRYLAASKQAMVLSRKNMNTEAAAQLKASGNIYDEMGERLDDLVLLNQNGAIESSHKGDRIYAEGQKIIIIASIVVTLLALSLMWYFEKIVSRPLEQITEVIKQLANGSVSHRSSDVSAYKALQDRTDEIGNTAKSVDKITQTLRLLTDDSLELIGAIQSGTLSARAEVAKHPGEYGEIINGMNKLLEVLNKPLSEISDVMQQFALGNLKTNMQGAYEGDLRALKANVNRSLDALVSLFAELGEISARMANGDLTKTVTGSYQGDFAALKNNMNNVLIQLSDSLRTIVSNTKDISSGVIETTKSSLQVADQSSQQMSAIVEMANAVTETSASIRLISENAKRGNELAGSTAQLAETGLQQLNKLVEVIEQISTEYSRIEQITGKITRIADKTHLLSLNAGLEAVRAGEHGLGFGFVAQQIGKLAEEASIAARDIGNLITGSMQSVRISVTGSRETRSAMQLIANAAQESGVAVQAISIALGQQSTAVDWISEKVRKVQNSSEANASSAKEISQTMAQLIKTVEQTNTQVQRFTLS
jgi:methyl-accepting chemotaxis protein